MNKIKRSCFLLLIIISSLASAQQTQSSSEILHELQKLQNVGSVLYIAAHPDDENTRLISYLTNYEKVDVSYLSLTRGDGGQNLVGTEIGEELGLIRTQELLAARNIDGAHQYFTRAVDFGYSKTPKETFNFWNKEDVLADVVWVIRKVQPDVIITRFSPEENPDRPTHGHHTASAQLAVEAFDAAADPNRFPEQLDDVKVWKTKDIYWNTSYWFYGSMDILNEKVEANPEQYLKMNVNQYLPLLGLSGSDISASSRSQHKSQGFGSAPVLDEQWEYLQGLHNTKAGESLFANIPTTWKERTGNSKLDKLITNAVSSYDINNPSASLTQLLDIRDAMDQVTNPVIKKRKLEEVNQLILNCMGLKATAFCSEQRVTPGQKVESRLEITVSADNIKLESVKGVGISGQFDLQTDDLSKGFMEKVVWSVPSDLSSQPYWLKQDKNGGMYVVDNQQLIGLPQQDYPMYLMLNLSVDGRPIPLKLPLLHSTTDPVKGQIIQPLVVTPKVMVNMTNEVYVFTQTASKQVDVEMVSGVASGEGYVELFVPDGWKVSPAFHKTSISRIGEIQHFSFSVTPPSGQSEGVVRAIFKDDENVYSMGIHQLNYDHIPHLAVFPSAQAKVVRVDLKKNGNLVGYVMGAGDKVPASILEMGYQLEHLTTADLLQKDLSKYDAIVFGIRALNTLDDVASTDEALTDYVNKGGNLVMQYNTSHRLKAQPLGPAEIKLSRDRVTEEDVEVTLLAPDHQVLTSPNKITAKDFENWVQERGLYFPNEWDRNMTPILSMHDTDYEPTEGSLLVGKYGEGHVVYTGLSFFRELPAGVPGAYRLLANILSL